MIVMRLTRKKMSEEPDEGDLPDLGDFDKERDELGFAMGIYAMLNARKEQLLKILPDLNPEEIIILSDLSRFASLIDRLEREQNIEYEGREKLR